MCTVVIDVAPGDAVRLLAVRDEDPHRAWDTLGPWWPDAYPGVRGIRDRRAGGAWLAINPAAKRLAVLLNRADMLVADPDDVVSRGSLVLESVMGRSPEEHPRTHGFNLVEVTPDAARVISWDGAALTETAMSAGVHMIAHHGLDDPATTRIAAWLPRFAEHRPGGEHWWREWLAVLAESSELDANDDRAIIRDNRAHGYPTLSLLYCTAEVTDAAIDIDEVTLNEPGRL